MTDHVPPAAPATPGHDELFDSPLDDAPPPHPLATFVGGFLMGSADIVPGVSGGTIALVIGIYERLIGQVRTGVSALSRVARADLRSGIAEARIVQWRFVVPLAVGILLAIGTLSSALDHLLEEQPILLSGLFLGLVIGSVVIAMREFDHAVGAPQWAVMAVTAVAVFALLGIRPGVMTDPSLLIFALGGSVAICAMILPGISGSFILLLIGLYDAVIGAVSDRDLVVVAAVGLGAIVGLALFSTLLHWLLANFHDVVLAALIGLMAGSLRVLWPWPEGTEGVGDTALGTPTEQVPATIGLALVGLGVVLLIAWLGDRYTRDA